MNTMIISAFPACGKTYLFENQDELLFNYLGNKVKFTFLDSESSKFEKYNGWEKKYVDYIEKNIGLYDFIFISMHEEVLSELQNRDIPFVTVAPDSMEYASNAERRRQLIKQQWFGRFVLRDNSHIKDFSSWIEMMSQNYDEWTAADHLTKYNPVAFFTLSADQYLSDIIVDLYWKKENYDNFTSRECNSIHSVDSFNK